MYLNGGTLNKSICQASHEQMSPLGEQCQRIYLVVAQVVLVTRHDVRLPSYRARLRHLFRLHRALLLHGQSGDKGGLRRVAGQGLGRQRGQCGGHRQRTRLSDQLPVENIGEGTLNAVVDGASAEGGEHVN